MLSRYLPTAFGSDTESEGRSHTSPPPLSRFHWPFTLD